MSKEKLSGHDLAIVTNPELKIFLHGKFGIKGANKVLLRIVKIQQLKQEVLT